jgi:preprotein translocase subunit SecG
MYGVVLALHLIVCIALVAVVLVQSGKGGGLAGGAFGGATQTVFGGRGATDFITKATVWLGVTFFVTSLVLAKLTTLSGPGAAKRSLIQEQARKAAQTAPATIPPASGGAAPQGGAPAGGAPAGGTPPPSGGSR